MEPTPYRQIRALYDDETIAVYQATSPVRIQWDPEQTLTLQPQPTIRSIQIGLSPKPPTTT